MYDLAVFAVYQLTVVGAVVVFCLFLFCADR